MAQNLASTTKTIAVTLAFSTAAHAQSAPAPQSTAVADNEGIQEIVVFAQKRNESVQDVPIAITTVSPTDIENWRLDNSNDLQNVTPNLTIGSVYQGTTPQITLRGVGVNDGIETTSPSVGTYIDQLYMGNAAAAVMSVFDMGRVEILRGPQGTLYGKNTNGGAINLYSQRPTEDFHAEIDLEGGNYSERSGTAFVSGPIAGPTLTGRIAVFYKDRDGYGQVLAPGPVEYDSKDVWAEHSYGIRAELLYKPNEDMQWLFIGSNGRNRITYGWPVIGLRSPGNPAVDCPNPLSGTCVDALGERTYSPTYPYSTIQDKLSSTTPETTIGTAQGTWTLGSVELTSISGYIHTHTRLIDDGASDYVGPGDLFYFDQNKRSDQFSQEFRVASVGKHRFNWTTGLFYSQNDLWLPVTYEFSLSPGTTNGKRVTESYAAFGQADYGLTDKLKVTLGARYSYTKLDSSSTNLGGFTTDAAHHWGNVGGRFGLDYQVTDGTIAYVSYNRGFKEGNLNVGIYGGAGPGAATVIQPEFIDAYEIGVKSDITHQLRVNGDFFYNKLKNMQVAGTDPSNFNFPTITNAARATTWGAELEAIAKPIQDLTVTANYGYLHARFNDYYVLSVLPGPPFPAVLVNASGNPIPLSPTNTFSGQAEYMLHFGSFGTISPRVNYSYRSAQAFTPEGTGNPRAAQSGYGLLGAGLKYDAENNFEIDVWGRNLTNKVYLVDVQPADSFNGSDFPTFGQPRMYGVTLRKKF